MPRYTSCLRPCCCGLAHKCTECRGAGQCTAAKISGKRQQPQEHRVTGNLRHSSAGKAEDNDSAGAGREEFQSKGVKIKKVKERSQTEGRIYQGRTSESKRALLNSSRTRSMEMSEMSFANEKPDRPQWHG